MNAGLYVERSAVNLLSRQLTKSASVVLSLLRGSGGPLPVGRATVPSLAAALPAERRVSARWGWLGEASGLSEQPAGYSASVSDPNVVRFPVSSPRLSTHC